MSDPTLQMLALRDGRRLGYLDFGDVGGAPLILCHGAPSCRLECLAPGLVSAAAELGVRIIAPDRPGVGQSDFQRKRTILDWPADVLALADSLSLSRFTVVGMSTGAPYAFACAVKAPERVRAIGLINGIGPLDRPELFAVLPKHSRLVLRLACRAPILARLMQRVYLRMLVNDPDRTLARTLATFAPPDQVLCERWQYRDGLVRLTRECLVQGSRGPVYDMQLVASPWGFDLADIRVPVLLWQGAQDRTVPAAHAHHLAATLPNCRASFYPTDGHLSVMPNRHREILTALRATQTFDANPDRARDVA